MTQAMPPDDGHRTESSALDAVPLAESQELDIVQPRYSTRGTAPGPRGCWAINRLGEPCASARRADSDYCNAHSGIGVANDPAKWAVVAKEKQAENRRRRATLRATLGITRPNSPRGLLKAAVYAQREAVALAALDGAISPEIDAKSRASHALKLLDAVEPLAQVTTELAQDLDPEGVSKLSLSQLLSIAEEHGIEAAPPVSLKPS